MLLEDQIKAYRATKGLSQQDLAEKLSVTQAMLSQMESGKRVISGKMLERLESKGVVQKDIKKAGKAVSIMFNSLKANDKHIVIMLLERLSGAKI